MTPNYLTTSEVAEISRMLAFLTLHHTHGGRISPQLIPNPIEFFDSNGESVGVISYSADADGYIFTPDGPHAK